MSSAVGAPLPGADRVLWLEDGRFTEIATFARDNVCGSLSEPARVVRLAWEGQAHYFCSGACRDQFEHEQGLDVGTLRGY